MSVDKFKFVSPGIFIDEIDESQVPVLPERMGPVVVGRFNKGPSNRPVKVESFKELVQIFGNPSDGTPSGEIWRNNALSAPTYGAYAAQAWLRNNSPCTVIRLLGKQASNKVGYSSNTKSEAGWRTTNIPANDIASAGGAYGLFVMPDPDTYSKTVATSTTIEISGNIGAKDGTVHAGTYGDILGTDMDTAKLKITVPKPIGSAAQASGITLIVTSSLTGTSGVTTAAAGTIHVSASSNLNLRKVILHAINGYDAPSGVVHDVAGAAGALVYGANAQGVTGVTASLGAGLTITTTAEKLGSLGNAITLSGSLASTTTHTLKTTTDNITNLAGGANHEVTGTLAAIWYVNDGAVLLEGTDRAGTTTSGSAVTIKSTDQKFTAKIVKDGTNTSNVLKSATFNFDRDSDLYIRKVFNTNPTKTNGDLHAAADVEHYWLGETFDTNVQKNLAVTGSKVSSTGDFLGVILGLEGISNQADFDWWNRLQNNQAATTGWFFSQDTRGTTTGSFDPTAHTTRLFKFHALDSGEAGSRDLKISLMDIKAPSDNFNTYGTFTVVVRRSTDTDNNMEILERFSGVNLNPNSANYIKRVIGDLQYNFDASTNVLRQLGQYENQSKYIRVEVADIVENQEANGLHPYGVYGPAVPKTFRLLSGSAAAGLTDDSGAAVKEYVIGGGSTYPSASLAASHVVAADGLVHHGAALPSLATTASIEFPVTRMRVSSSEGGLIKGTQAFFGYQSNLEGTKRFDNVNLDLLRGGPASFNSSGAGAKISDHAQYQYSWVFTLDDIKVDPTDSNHAIHVSGSRAAGTSYSAQTGSSAPLDSNYNRFTTPLVGGFDGFDITEKHPFRNTYLDGGAETTNYAYHTIKKAIDMISDSEFVEFDLATIPGITNASLLNHLVTTCEERGDALALLDIKGDHEPAHEASTSEASRIGTVSSAVTNLKGMNLNSSYGAAFYPFVQIRDLINDSVLYVPPSVVALGTMSSAQRKSAVWFAPAGFTRGGLSEGSAGIPVMNVKQRLTSTDRDKLYDANINPIASFPAEGVVIFGQKTLQVTPSALDRINVRRLLIHVKKEVSRIASRILFDQNVQSTWDRFVGQVKPFLEGVKSGLGLTDFRIVLDETTTTDDLVDRNILYAKIFLKPARAIEFIALDFIITRSGASFDD